MFTVASAYGQILFVLDNLLQFNLFYIEDSITELNINDAQRRSSIAGLASLAGHNVTRSISAEGEIELYWGGTETEIPGGFIIIPQNTVIRNKNNGLLYFIDPVEEDIRIPLELGKRFKTKVVQGTVERQSFAGRGNELQSFTINLKDNISIEHFRVNVFVNGEKWEGYDSLWDIPKDGKGYLVKTGITEGISVYFGNGYFGAIPPLGADIQVEYIRSDGFRGNLDLPPEEVFWEWDETGFSIFGDEIDLNEALGIRNVIPPDFGSNPEQSELTRLIAPKTSRSFILANTDNYNIFLQKFNQFSIIEAYNTFDDDFLDDDNIVYLFLVPDVAKRLRSNENYFSIPENRFTLSETQKIQIINLIEKSGRKIVTTELFVVDPIIEKYVINISISIFEGYNPDLIKTTILQRLSEYFLSIRRRDKIPRSDLIALIEGVE
jgi:hypothetical protein